MAENDLYAPFSAAIPPPPPPPRGSAWGNVDLSALPAGMWEQLAAMTRTERDAPQRSAPYPQPPVEGGPRAPPVSVPTFDALFGDKTAPGGQDRYWGALGAGMNPAVGDVGRAVITNKPTLLGDILSGGAVGEGVRMGMRGELTQDEVGRLGPAAAIEYGLLGPPRAVGSAVLGAGVPLGTGKKAAKAAAAEPASVGDAFKTAPYPNAPFPQYAEAYPPVGPPITKLKDKPKFPGETYEGKLDTPESKAFQKARTKIQKDMDEKGYTPYFDPEKRFDVDPKNYPLNIDSTMIVPKTLDTMAKHFDKVGAVETRKALQDAYAKGVELGGKGPRLTTQDWYMMGQLEEDLVRQMGPEAGRAAFREKFATSMAATTGGMNPRANLIAAGHQNYLASRGERWPVTNQWPTPVGGRYGEQLSGTAQKIADEGGFKALMEGHPKRHNFAGNFMGHRTPATMDEQMTMGMTGQTVPDYYGVNERVMAQEAAKAGVDPRKFQETGWAGFKGEAGGPMISEVNAAIERMHRLTGMPREEIVRRAWGTGDIPVYGVPGVIGAGAAAGAMSGVREE